jgi:hypothetical protein
MRRQKSNACSTDLSKLNFRPVIELSGSLR